MTRPNLTKSLRALGYTDIASSDPNFAFAYAGRTLSQMANEFNLKDVTNYIADHPEIKALIVGGGGNDVVSGYHKEDVPLYKMLRPRGDGAPALDDGQVSAFIDHKLADHYNAILTALTESTRAPIILHAYDHPIPDGRGDNILGHEIGPWLYPYFIYRGYTFLPSPPALPSWSSRKRS